MSEEITEDKQAPLWAGGSGFPIRTPKFILEMRHNVIKVERSTTRKKAKLLCEIPDDLAADLISQISGMSGFEVPVRGLALHWTSAKVDGVGR